MSKPIKWDQRMGVHAFPDNWNIVWEPLFFIAWVSDYLSVSMCAPALGSEKTVCILQILYYKHAHRNSGDQSGKFSTLYSHLIGIWYPNDTIWPDNLSNNLFWASKLTYSDLLFMIATSWKFQCFTSSKWVHWATECYHKIHEVRKDECKLELLAQMWTYYVSVYDHTH